MCCAGPVYNRKSKDAKVINPLSCRKMPPLPERRDRGSPKSAALFENIAPVEIVNSVFVCDENHLVVNAGRGDRETNRPFPLFP